MNGAFLKPGTQVRATERLMFRLSGSKDGYSMAIVNTGATIHMVIEPNEDRYACGYVFGHRPRGPKNVLWNEAGPLAEVEVSEYDQECFTPIGKIDNTAEFQAGIVEGWFCVDYVRL